MERKSRYAGLEDFEASLNVQRQERVENQSIAGGFEETCSDDGSFEIDDICDNTIGDVDEEEAAREEGPSLSGKVTHLKSLPDSTLVVGAKMRSLDSEGHEALSVGLVDGAGAKVMQCLIKPYDFAAVAMLTGYEWADEEDVDELVERMGAADLVAGYEVESVFDLLRANGLAVQPKAWMNVREEWTRLQVERGKMDVGEQPVKLIICALKNHYNSRIVTALDEAVATQRILENVIKENVNSEKDERHAIRVYCFFSLLAAVFALIFVVRGELLVALLCALIAGYLVSMLPNLRRKRGLTPASVQVKE